MIILVAFRRDRRCTGVSSYFERSGVTVGSAKSAAVIVEKHI